MIRVRLQKRGLALLSVLACFFASARAQDSDATSLNASGQIVVNGRATAYLIRHLPVNAFPQLPLPIQQELTRRGCLIPQSYEARGPENVVNASLQSPGSSDWAVLCTTGKNVSLLVFFSGAGSDPTVLATALETERLQLTGSGKPLGFNWAIDPASPQQIRQAQLGMKRIPPRPDHDALADSTLDQRTVYHFFTNNAWILLDTHD